MNPPYNLSALAAPARLVAAPLLAVDSGAGRPPHDSDRGVCVDHTGLIYLADAIAQPLQKFAP